MGHRIISRDTCPYCLAGIDVCVPDTRHVTIPQPGDMATCHQCNEILFFGKNHRLRKPDKHEKRAIRSAGDELKKRLGERNR